MPHHDHDSTSLPTLATDDLDAVIGGANIGAIASHIGGIVDGFTGGTEGQQIGGIVGQIAGLFGK